jgi:hypothetical protein
MRKIIPLTLILAFGVYHACFGAMSSSNYKINSDVLAPGGWPSESSSYRMGDTLGESVIGEGSSTNYSLGAGFWYAGRTLNCEASTVYMQDYTLGNPLDYNKKLFTVTEQCEVINYAGSAWSLTISSSNMTGSGNTLLNSNVCLVTDDVVGSGDTVTSAIAPAQIGAIDEPAAGEYCLNTTNTIVSGTDLAQGQYNIQPSIKLKNLNALHVGTISGTLIITLQ